MAITIRTLIRTLIVLLVAVAGLANGAMAGSFIPFKGSDVGTFGLPGLCGDGSLQVVIEGSGTATHFGRYSYAATECFSPITGAFTGVPTISTANGDELFGTYSGQVAPTSDPDVVTYTESLVISGGTGRFAGASGVFDVTGVANLATLEYSQDLAGILSKLGGP
jgi:hypothetical protein